ncbi:MAG: hypothetical protein CMF50_02415 [Legionellales bacterium]|nr:hypothetical protein [Legionellales bacterium]
MGLIQRKGLTVDDFTDYILGLSVGMANKYFNNLRQYLWEFPPQDKNTTDLWALMGMLGQMGLGGNPCTERRDRDMRDLMRTQPPQVPNLRQMYQCAKRFTQSGLTYSHEGKYRAAHQSYKEALAQCLLIPACNANVLAKCYFNLAFSAEKCGDTAQAQEYGRLVAELAINNRTFSAEFMANCIVIQEHEAFEARTEVDKVIPGNNTLEC